MEPDSRTGQARSASTVTPLDQVLWGVLTNDQALLPFAAAWLALLCRMLPGAERAVLVLRQEDALAPVARWPEGDPGSAALSQIAELALTERRGVLSRSRARTEDGRTAHLAFPLRWDDQGQGVVAVELDAAGDAALRDAMRQLQWGASWIELRHWRVRSTGTDVRLKQGYAALDVAASALAAEGFDGATRASATDLAIRLGAERVCIGWLHRSAIRVAGMSHAVGGGRRADATVNLAAAMEEAVDQGASVAWPIADGETLPSRSAHARLISQGGGPNVLTVPLTLHGRIAGAITVEHAQPIAQDTVDLTEAVAALLGPILGQARMNERWLAVIAWDIAARTLRQLFGAQYLVLKLSTALAVAVVAFFALFHAEYRVTAQSVLEGEVRRSIAAGLDGYIGSENARAGQIVHQGDVLATLDDAELNLQRLRWMATRQQHQLELDKALAGGSRADVNIDSAQVNEASAEIALLDAQLARTKIIAPFDGLITSGDLSQSVGMPVQRAQVLFEIAPLDSYRVIVRVPDNEIARVTQGATGSLVLSALPDRHFDLRVARITPIAEQTDGSNTFRVEAVLDGTSPQLRPNMEGVAKLNAGRHLLIWAWTHHLIDTVRLALWSWWP